MSMVYLLSDSISLSTLILTKAKNITLMIGGDFMDVCKKLLRDSIRNVLYDCNVFCIKFVAESIHISNKIYEVLETKEPKVLQMSGVSKNEFYHIVRDILEHENNCQSSRLFKKKKLRRDIGTVKIDKHGKFKNGTNVYIFGCMLD